MPAWEHGPLTVSGGLAINTACLMWQAKKMSNVYIATVNIEKFRELISKENDPERTALLTDLLTR